MRRKLDGATRTRGLLARRLVAVPLTFSGLAFFAVVPSASIKPIWAMSTRAPATGTVAAAG